MSAWVFEEPGVSNFSLTTLKKSVERLSTLLSSFSHNSKNPHKSFILKTFERPKSRMGLEKFSLEILFSNVYIEFDPELIYNVKSFESTIQ
jgi:hypothetical protein